MKLEELKEEQLDEGVVQNIFDYLWSATGKVLDKLPIVGDKRKEARILQDYDNFVKKMDEATTNKWIDDLTSKLKSTHPATVKASTRRIGMLKRNINTVKASKGAKEYVSRMNNMRASLKQLENFIKASNQGIATRKRKAKAKANA